MREYWRRQLRRNINRAARSKRDRAVFVRTEIRREVGEASWQELRALAQRRKVALVECK